MTFGNAAEAVDHRVHGNVDREMVGRFRVVIADITESIMEFEDLMNEALPPVDCWVYVDEDTRLEWRRSRSSKRSTRMHEVHVSRTDFCRLLTEMPAIQRIYLFKYLPNLWERVAIESRKLIDYAESLPKDWLGEMSI